MWKVGCTGRAELVVTPDDTAPAWGSGDVPVLATPRVVALAEAATLAALAGQSALTDDPGRTTVGVRVELDHVAPSAVGAEVVAEAHLTGVDGRRLEFVVAVHERRGSRTVPIATGRIDRVAVNRDRFLAGVVSRS
jgi:fluoroacetyl-CoA thioesterase